MTARHEVPEGVRAAEAVAILEEQARAEMAVLAEAIEDAQVCAHCGLLIGATEQAVILKTSDRPSEIAHQECEDGLERMTAAARLFGTHGVRGLQGIGMQLLKTPRD